MTNRFIPSIEREVGNRRPGNGTLFIKANLADVVMPFNDDDEDAAFGREITGDMDEVPTVDVIVGVETECKVRGPVADEVVAVVHPVVILAVVVVVLEIAVAIVVILIPTIVFFSFVILTVVVVPLVLVLAIAFVQVLLMAPVVVAVMVVLVLATIIVFVLVILVVVVVVVVPLPMVVARLLSLLGHPPGNWPLPLRAVVTVGAQSRATVVTLLPLGDTGKNGFSTSMKAA
jgi:hypothetical protein